MRIPQTAPRLDDLQREVFTSSPERLHAILSGSSSPTVDGKYLRWDELRHHPAPGDLTRREWWLALKLQRRVGSKPLALRSNGGRPFSYVVVEQVAKLLHEIDLGAGGQIGMADPITNSNTRDHYYVRSLMQEAITSSQLEGATTTRKVAKEMLRSGRDPRDRSERMILNNYLTMKRIGELRDEDLSRELVFELHGLVTDGALDDPSAAGRFRRADERIHIYDDRSDEVVYIPPGADELDERLEAMLAFANDRNEPFVHPVVRSILLHFWLAYDHPFVDGNGRTARALFYWSMLRHKYWLFEFISISATILRASGQYYRAFLHSETDDEDATYFLVHQIGVIDRAIRDLHEFIDRRTRELAALEADLRGLASLNHRQRDLVRHALRHPHADYTIAEHRVDHGVVYATARADLLDLEARGLLISSKRGRTMHFRPAPQLQERLRELD